MLRISNHVGIPLTEIEMSAIRAQGPGGQNVNKVSNAVHLRFDIMASSLPDFYKNRLVKLSDHRITKEGVVVIKCQEYRSLEKNREAAFARLTSLVKSVSVVKKKRVPTKPSKNSQKKRMDKKTNRSKLKQSRRKVDY